MLTSEPTKGGAGVIIYGDGNDLRSLHSTIHGLVENAPLGGRLAE